MQYDTLCFYNTMEKAHDYVTPIRVSRNIRVSLSMCCTKPPWFLSSYKVIGFFLVATRDMSKCLGAMLKHNIYLYLE